MIRRAAAAPHPTTCAPALAAALALACAALAFARDARAQGWALDRYEPNPAGDLFFAADFPRYNAFPVPAVSVIADYARNPLVVRTGEQRSASLIENMFVLHVQGSFSLFNRVELNASVPIALLQTGASNIAGSNLGAYGGPVTGDVRLGVRGRIFGESDRSPISLHLGFYGFLGFIPYNAREHNVTDEDFRFKAYATIAGHPGPVRWSFTAGYHFRPSTALPGLYAIDDDVFLNAAVGFTSVDQRLTIGPEGWVAILLDPGPGASPNIRRVAAEALLGIHYLIADRILIGAAGGPGISQLAGTPEIRGLLRVSYAPERRDPARATPLDADRDGVLDVDDQCVNEPQGASPDPARRGCPRRDTDRDGVWDGDDECPSQPRGEHPDPARAGCPAGDRDRDGVVDPLDQCVSEPQGEHPDPERAGCPDGDDDGDSVRNHADACRAEVPGPHPDPARPGCPLPDRDHDSVPDPSDHCPDQPGAPHPDPNQNGCPGLVRVEGGQVRILQQVFFATNRDTILPRSNAVLDAVANALRASPDIRRVAIEGHTDNVGPDARNLQLSQRRAESVMRWLTQHGIEPARLEAHGYGETRPLVTNDTRDGRAQNRRVEFHIVDPPPPAGAASSAAPPSGSTAPATSAPATSESNVRATSAPAPGASGAQGGSGPPASERPRAAPRPRAPAPPSQGVRPATPRP